MGKREGFYTTLVPLPPPDLWPERQVAINWSGTIQLQGVSRVLVFHFPPLGNRETIQSLSNVKWPRDKVPIHSPTTGQTTIEPVTTYSLLRNYTEYRF